MSKEFLGINEGDKTNAAIEAMKRGFNKAKGSSLGDVRRAASGIKESPTAMTEAEKEMAEIKPLQKVRVACAKKSLEDIARKEFEDREESMALYEEVVPSKEQIPMAKMDKISGIEIPKEVAQNKKKSKSFLSRFGAWLMS